MAGWRRYIKKTIFLLLSIAVGSVFSFVFQPLVKSSSLDVLVNIYSILAGFLIGVIALIGDPSSLPKGSWRIAESASRNTYRSLQGARNLLYIYLITLLAIFMYKLLFVDGLELIEKISILNFNIGIYILRAKNIFEYIILFTSAVAFIYSFKLPGKLFSIQKDRVSKEIDDRRL